MSTCRCAYYEPGLIVAVHRECPEHGEDAQRLAEESRAMTRAKLKAIGVSEADLRELGFVPCGRWAHL